MHQLKEGNSRVEGYQNIKITVWPVFLPGV